MSGPRAGILLPIPLNEAQHATLHQIITAISTQQEGQDFWVRSTIPVQGTIDLLESARPFMVHTMEPAWIDTSIDGATMIERHFGCIPQQELLFSAGCNAAIDHRILGEIVLYIARLWAGLIDFDGALTPHAPPHYDPLDPTDWTTIASPIETYLRTLAGTIIAIPYRTAAGNQWVSHVADSIFLDHWRTTALFTMIK